ncbi:MAG: glucose 1-dehydrogenase [Pseudomonadales bacterium]|jgi:NAD(P)-dependent dehydrogenase (short-subunit alcohol dehydrogenase family)|nr:glucose 1-dehydrogenase [Pseudomonadales bacterium]
MGRLEGKVAIVTGAASGIGRGTVAKFIAEGAQVVAADLQDDKGQALLDEFGDAVRFMACDVAHEDEMAALVALATDAFGRLDCIFNNAGFGGVSGAIEETDLDGPYVRTLDAMLKGPLLGMKYAVPIMKAQGSGSIITTASVAGLMGGYGPHVYSAVKAGVIGLTRSVARELGPFGIRANAICPGGIATPIFAGRMAQDAGGNVDHAGVVRPFLALMQPIRRAGEPADIANAACFLASDEASFITGQALVVDGGLTTASPLPPDGSEGGLDLLAQALGMEDMNAMDGVLPERRRD